MTNRHPSFSYPMIQEALCEVHFRREDDAGWNPSLFGEVFKALERDYPNLEPASEVGLQLKIGAEGIGQGVLPPRQLMRYRHRSRNLLVQLRDGVLTVNVLAEYPGWAQMRADVLDAWGRAAKPLAPASILRVGLRYINVIPQSNADETAATWLKESAYVPSGALGSLPGFLSRVEARLSQTERLVVTVGDGPAVEGQPASIVFDIDRIDERELGPTTDALTACIEGLHDSVWQVFESSLTDRLRSLLEQADR